MDQFKAPGINRESLTDSAAKAHAGIDKVAEKTSAGVHRARDASHQAVDHVAATAAGAADWADEHVQQIKRKQDEFTEAATDRISARPFIAWAPRSSSGTCSVGSDVRHIRGAAARGFTEMRAARCVTASDARVTVCCRKPSS
jgi:hypothetical protein